MGIARRAPETQHRVFLFRLEIGAGHEICIFIGLEVGQPHDDRPRIERRRDRADALGQPFDEEIRRLLVAAASAA